jgi:hypothetical protein
MTMARASRASSVTRQADDQVEQGEGGNTFAQTHPHEDQEQQDRDVRRRQHAKEGPGFEPPFGCVERGERERTGWHGGSATAA